MHFIRDPDLIVMYILKINCRYNIFIVDPFSENVPLIKRAIAENAEYSFYLF